MSNTISAALLNQLYKQESDVPFLTLITLSHIGFSDIRFVNNTEDIVSRGNTFTAFPVKLVLPKDDGESAREISIEFDNTGLELVTLLRSVTDFVNVKLEMVLSNAPDAVQMSFEELKIQSISYNKSRVSAKLFMDTFLNTNMTSETYTPTIYPGLF